MPPAPGSRLASYELLSPLGAGGMGDVYRARDTRLNREVAIKLLPASTSSDPKARERLRQEALSAAALDHPYICKIFEIGEQGDVQFLVMEYIPGETLHQRLQSGPMPLADVLRLGGEISEGLQEAHARGIVHRDLKPANIMLTAQGHVKIMDFGLAKRVGGLLAASDETAEMQPQLTAPGALIGTLEYMSPEQVKGQVLDARSDLFSFGVILAEMAGGRHPFRKSTNAETLAAILREPPELGPATPPNLAAILRRLLAKSAAERYASAAEVRAALVKMPAARSVRWMWPVAVVLLILLSVATYLLVSRLWSTASSIRSIAVLPLDNYSGDPSQDYFAEGMTDELTTDLANISRLRVISRGSVMQFKGKQRPPTPEIARILNVDAVVEGSVLRSGDRVRISAQLIDARADLHIWAKNFESNSRDVLALQDELASAIAREIRVQLTPAEQSRLSATRTVKPEAYDAYLRGRYFFNRPSDENLLKAIAKFDEATRLNPDFAPAYSGLSDAYLWAGYNEDAISGSDARPKAKAAAEKAIQLDNNSAEAHASLATFKLFYDYDFAGSEAEYRRSIALNPNYAFAHDQFGLGLALHGRFNEAITEGRRAAELDPLSPQVFMDAIFAYAWKGDMAEAQTQLRKSAELDPTFYFVPFGAAWIEIQQGKASGAIADFQRSKAAGAPSFASAWLGYAYAITGDRTRALAELDEQRKLSPRGYVPAFNSALVYLGRGDRSRALDFLERAYATDSQWLCWIRNDHAFDPLRSDPRFIALLKKVNSDL